MTTYLFRTQFGAEEFLEASSGAEAMEMASKRVAEIYSAHYEQEIEYELIGSAGNRGGSVVIPPRPTREVAN